MGIPTESESERGASSLQLDTWGPKAPLWCGGLRLAEHGYKNGFHATTEAIIRVSNYTPSSLGDD